MKRLEVKYIRDFSKSAYKKDKECFICGTDQELQLHHYYSMTLLWEKWKKERKVKIENVEDILKYREEFVQDHHVEVYDEVVTLCKHHHMDKLHGVYGKVPPLYTASKQKQWCLIQRSKLNEIKID